MTRRAFLRAALCAAGAAVPLSGGMTASAAPRVHHGLMHVGRSMSGAGRVSADVYGEPDVYRATLHHGLRVVVRERPGSEVVAVAVAIRGGSRDEEAETVGAAHFMEHMYFQGTPRRPDSIDFDRDIEARGGWTNAWTGWESINFQAVAPRDSFDLALDIVADQMTSSLFPAEKVRKERQVVLEELNGRLNNPSSRARDLFLLAAFGDHPARNLPIGNRDTVNQATREVLVRFRDTYFVASNMAVAVVGDVDRGAVVSKVEAAFDGMRTGPVPPFKTAPMPRPTARQVSAPSPGRQARVVLGGPAPGHDSADRFALDVGVALLGDAGRRLEQEIVDRARLASSVDPSYSELTDVGVWSIAAGLPAANIDATTEAIRAELRRLIDEPVSTEDLAEAVAYIRGNLLLHRERSVDLAEKLSDGEVLGAYESLDGYFGHLQAVTPDDVRRVARDYLDPEQNTVVVLRP